MRRQHSSDIEKVRTNRYLSQKLGVLHILDGDDLYLQFFQYIGNLGTIQLRFCAKDGGYPFALESELLKSLLVQSIIELLIVFAFLEYTRKSSLGKSDRVEKNKKKRCVHDIR